MEDLIVVNLSLEKNMQVSLKKVSCRNIRQSLALAKWPCYAIHKSLLLLTDLHQEIKALLSFWLSLRIPDSFKSFLWKLLCLCVAFKNKSQIGRRCSLETENVDHALFQCPYASDA